MQQNRIFVSHSSADNDICAKYVAALKKLGLNTWYDNYNLKHGKLLPNELGKHIEESTSYIIMLSQNAVQSEWVAMEIALMIQQHAEDKSKAIIPVILEACSIPPFLKIFTPIYATEIAFDDTVKTIYSAFHIPENEQEDEAEVKEEVSIPLKKDDVEIYFEHPLLTDKSRMTMILSSEYASTDMLPVAVFQSRSLQRLALHINVMKAPPGLDESLVRLHRQLWPASGITKREYLNGIVIVKHYHMVNVMHNRTLEKFKDDLVLYFDVV